MKFVVESTERKTLPSFRPTGEEIAYCLSCLPPDSVARFMTRSALFLDRMEESIKKRRLKAKCRQMQIDSGLWRERVDLVAAPYQEPIPLWRVSNKELPRCGATTRKGTPCKAPCVPYKDRCRLHGGLSTGPKTAEGRERISESNRRRWAAYREQKLIGEQERRKDANLRS